MKNNGFNPVWEEALSLPFDCVGDMRELVFVRFAVRQEGADEDKEPLAVYGVSLGSLREGEFLLFFFFGLQFLGGRVVDDADAA